MQKLLLGWGAQPVDAATDNLRNTLLYKTLNWNRNIYSMQNIIAAHVPVQPLVHLILEYLYVFDMLPGGLNWAA